MRHFCTYFDANYLTRGLALYRSLARHAGELTFWVLCFDDASFDALTKLGEPQIRPIRLADFERGDEALVATKAERTTVEYYFTCTPSLPLYVLRHDPGIDAVTYVDADLLFYSDPADCIADRPGRSVTIIPHGFPPQLQHLEEFGIYNVGLLSFRNDADGRACLARWRRECLDWCFDRIEDGRFADQKYLDQWPATQPGVVVIDDPGTGVAPWNFMIRGLDWMTEPPTANGRPFVFFHFQGFKQRAPHLFELGLAGYGRMSRAERSWLYGGYLDALNASEAELEAHGIAVAKAQSKRKVRLGLAHFGAAFVRGQLMLVTPWGRI